MIVNTSYIDSLVALEDDFGIIAKYTAIRSPIYQCSSSASLDCMHSSVNLESFGLGYSVLFRHTHSNFANVAF